MIPIQAILSKIVLVPTLITDLFTNDSETSFLPVGHIISQKVGSDTAIIHMFGSLSAPVPHESVGKIQNSISGVATGDALISTDQLLQAAISASIR